MLNEIIKTAEELNTAALYYRQSGNMDGVRELAKAHAVSRKQTEAFIQGSRYRLVEIPIGERKFVNASEKLRAEMFILKDAGFADIIGQYLVNLAKTDSALEAQVLKRHKMLQRCLDYVTQKAYNVALEAAKKRERTAFEPIQAWHSPVTRFFHGFWNITRKMMKRKWPKKSRKKRKRSKRNGIR